MSATLQLLRTVEARLEQIEQRLTHLEEELDHERKTNGASVDKIVVDLMEGSEP